MLVFQSFNMDIFCFFVFLVGALFLCVIMLLMGVFLGGRSILSYSKNVPFESGVREIGTARLKFSVKFYIIGICFVIFDAEALYLYIWSIVIRESGWFGLMEISFFICILLFSLMYLIFMNALHWRKFF